MQGVVATSKRKQYKKVKELIEKVKKHRLGSRAGLYRDAKRLKEGYTLKEEGGRTRFFTPEAEEKFSEEVRKLSTTNSNRSDSVLRDVMQRVRHQLKLPKPFWTPSRST